MVETIFGISFIGVVFSVFVGCICFEAGQARAKRKAERDEKAAVERHVRWLEERARSEVEDARKHGVLFGRNEERSRWAVAVKEILDEA